MSTRESGSSKNSILERPASFGDTSEHMSSRTIERVYWDSVLGDANSFLSRLDVRESRYWFLRQKHPGGVHARLSGCAATCFPRAKQVRIQCMS